MAALRVDAPAPVQQMWPSKPDSGGFYVVLYGPLPLHLPSHPFGNARGVQPRHLDVPAAETPMETSIVYSDG